MSKSLRVNHDNYILKVKTNIDEKAATKGTLLAVIPFLLAGCPCSWNIQDTLWLELSWFEDSQPEKEDLASWLILMQSMSALTFLLLLYIETHVYTFPKMKSLFCASSATVIISIVLSFAWNFSLGGISIFLLLGAAVGQMVGWTEYIFVIPWIVMNYDPRLISAFVSGNAFMVINLVILQVIQEPGGARNFSPTVFYLLAAIIYAATFGVCLWTFMSGFARLTPKDAVQKLKPWRRSLWTQTFPTVFWDTKLYTFGRVWANQLSWTMVPIALPYAAEHTSNKESNSGEDFLQWAIAMGYIMVLAGSLGSYIPTKKYWIRESLILNTISNGVVLIAAGNFGDWSTWPMKLVLMTCIMASRFTFAWVIPMCLRELTRRYPDQKELLVRSNSLWSMYGNILFRFVLFMITRQDIFS